MHRRGANAARVLALALAVSMMGSAARAGIRGELEDPYWFATSASAVHSVLVETADAHHTDLGGLHFTWPHAARSWDTALIAMRARDAAPGSWVEISVGGQRVIQYLDGAAAGVRWLNLSGLRERLAAGAEVTLRPQGVTLETGAADLRLFDNHLNLRRRILVLAPHPDDAEVAAFGLYADRRATVVTVTAGNAGDMNYRANISDPAEHYALKGTLRALDSVTVPWQGGIPPSHTANLGYFDGRLDAMYVAPRQTFAEVYGPNTDVARYRRVNLSRFVSSAPRANSWEHLVQDLVQVLKKTNPQVVVMPDPRLDTHPDHEFASVALDAALAQWRGDPVFLLYFNHHDEDHYPYGPAGSVVSLPPNAVRVPLQGVYSHPTLEALQTRKLFALESMHDLRLSPQEQIDCVAPGARSAERRPDNPRIPETDYFRRAVRANELFLVFDRKGVRALIAEFRAGYRGGR